VVELKSYQKIYFLFFILLAHPTQAQDEILREERPAFSEKPDFSPQYKVRFGAGVTQSRYAQTVPQFVDIGISDDLGPTLHFDAGAWMSWHWGLETYFKNTPGEFKSSPATEVKDGNYSFRRAGLELLYRSHPVFKKQRKEHFLKLGLHQHDLPFLRPVSNVTLQQQHSRVRTVSFGFEHHRDLKQGWRLESFLRYQYPYTTGVTPHLALDGSVGVLRHFQNHWILSIFWTGEWHDYKYETGYQNLFQSTFDLRTGVEF
jgi:hypothetical protein